MKQIFDEALKNKAQAAELTTKGDKAQGYLLGGILYKPPANASNDDTFVRSFFNAKQ